ncbi:CIA30 family protein [Flavobacterium tiangeerense]|uniref:CIA30 family protein n=1 Tax=Flavobacterium tiangeerense TaxID=459471 RepID=UPI0011A73F27|nr:CIA30 family protein [Flavobacterium tiangeerense]
MKPLLLFHFDHSCDLSQWRIVNDSVMGGISSSFIICNTDGKGLFTGTVSLENNGGFCAVKYTFDSLSLQDAKSFSVRLKGDGKAYQFRVKNKISEAHSYVFAFETTTDRQTINIPISELKPAFRGQKLNLPAYDGKQLQEITFLIGNKKNETFELAIESITII